MSQKGSIGKGKGKTPQRTIVTRSQLLSQAKEDSEGKGEVPSLTLKQLQEEQKAFAPTKQLPRGDNENPCPSTTPVQLTPSRSDSTSQPTNGTIRPRASSLGRERTSTPKSIRSSTSLSEGNNTLSFRPDTVIDLGEDPEIIKYLESN